jgi:hypothetical protein
MKDFITPFISGLRRIGIDLQKYRQHVRKFRIILHEKLRFYRLPSKRKEN